MAKDRLKEIIDSEEFKSIPEMSKDQGEQMRKMCSRYILVGDKNNRKHGECEYCNTEVNFNANTKHKEEVICPNCGRKMKVIHTYRKKNCDYDPYFFLNGVALNKDVFVIRYYKVYHEKNYSQYGGECAREIFDFKTSKRFRVDRDYSDTWTKSQHYFMEFNYPSYYFRKDFCMCGHQLQTNEELISEMKKIDMLKWYPVESRIGTYGALSNDIKGLFSAPLYEKMEKVGLKRLVDEDFGENRICWNKKATSLVKMLRLDRQRYKMLFTEKADVCKLKFIQKYKMSQADYEYVFRKMGMYRYSDMRREKMSDPIKLNKYLIKADVREYEYKHYHWMLKAMGYDLTDEYYIYPKDFRKADDRVSKEYNEWKEEQERKAAEEERKRLSERDVLVKKISDGLRNMDNLKEFMSGSNGLLVYVPESVGELKAEGMLLHNCLGSYAERVAEGKTLVFFIRRLSDPTAPFVAFEYCNGDVVQCRYDHNRAVEDDTEEGAKILNFVDKFTEQLRKNKVLYKAA